MKKAPEQSNYKKIGVFGLSIFGLLVLVLSSTSTYALDLLGPPAGEIRKGEINAGIEYSLSTMEFELTNGSWKEESVSRAPDSGDAIDLVLKDFETEKMNAYFGCGIERNWEVFVRLGTVSSEFGDSLFNNSESFDSDYTPSIGGGMRMTFVDNYNFKIGAVAQAGWAKYNGRLSTPLWYSPGFVTVDLKEIQASIGALYQWTDRIAIYGGPFYNYVFGSELKFEDVRSDPLLSAVVTSEFTWDIEASSSFGGYLGSRIDIGKKSYINFEYQMTGDSDVLGAGIVWVF